MFTLSLGIRFDEINGGSNEGRKGEHMKKRPETFKFRLSNDERRAIADLAAHLQHSQSAAVRFVIVTAACSIQSTSGRNYRFRNRRQTMFKDLFITILRAWEMTLKAKGINSQTKSLLLILFAIALIFLVIWLSQILALLILLRW